MFNPSNFIKKEILSSVQAKVDLLSDEALLKTVSEVTEIVISAYLNNGKTIFAGNGGSAADAQHLAAEFVARFNFDRPALPSMSLSSDPSVVTATSNDYGYENLFSRQIEAFGQRGDVFFGITTSGKSPNVLKALEKAKLMGLTTVGLTSIKAKNTDMPKYCDHLIMVPSEITSKIQECHITIGHAICAAVEESLFKV
jgi:D-sedoheptulose 7-phosphate isomerase